MKPIATLMRLTFIVLALWRAKRLRRDRGRAHVYCVPKTPDEWAVGKDRCVWCLRHDPRRTRYTKPPCPGADPVRRKRKRSGPLS